MQETYFTKANIQLQKKHMLQPDTFKYEQNQIAGELYLELLSFRFEFWISIDKLRSESGARA